MRISDWSSDVCSSDLDIAFDTPAGSVGAWRADPVSAPRGGLVVVQEIFGVNTHVRSVADRYAAAGYVALAPAFFDPVERGVELGRSEERRVGKEWASTFRSRWGPDHEKKKSRRRTPSR